MSSMLAALPVARPPRVRRFPEAAVDSDGSDACFLASRYGLTADDWQEDTLHGWMARRPDGRYAAARCGLTVPRQNGKNVVIEIRELFGIVVIGEKFLHTAHEVKTARKAFLRLASFFEDPRFPELRSLVKEIRRTNGQEAIVLTNGGSVEFIARTKGSGRGFTVDVLVIDEAQELTDDTLSALLPTISAAPLGNPQQIYSGTPPSSKMDGEIFTRVRTAGKDGTDPRLAWYEWSAEDGVDLDDETVWEAVNPALGDRLNKDTVMSERASMDDASFLRERLGVWESEGGFSVIDPEIWDSVSDEVSEPEARMVLAIDVSPDRSTASISMAGLRSDERWHIELIENRRGTGWVVNRAKGIKARHGIRSVIVDASGPAASLVEALKKAGFVVIQTQARDMAAACGEFYDAAVEGRLVHIDQPILNYALSQARKRRLGDAWAWNRATSASDITPVVSVTLALWGAQSSRVKRKKRAPSSSTRKVVVYS